MSRIERVTLYSPVQPVVFEVVGETEDLLIDSFTTLYARLQPPFFIYAARRIGDVFKAEDLVQEAFLKAWGSWPNFHPKGERRSEDRWAYRIIRNLTIDHVRLRMQTVPLEDITDKSAVVQNNDAEFGEAEKSLRLKEEQTGVAFEVALLNLAPMNNQQRDVLIKHFILGKPFAQIAIENGNSKAGVKQLAQRGKRILRKFYPADD